MILQPGSILISAPSMDDPQFEKVVLLLTGTDENGSVGFVMNQLFERKFNELVEFRHSRDLPLYSGGPVEKESLYFIHRYPNLVNDGIPLKDGYYFGGDFKQAVRLINNKTINEPAVRLFVGYSGWDKGQLETEIAEGSWIVANAPLTLLFSLPVTEAWDRLLQDY